MNKRSVTLTMLLTAMVILTLGTVTNTTFAASDTQTVKDVAGKKITIPKKVKKIADFSNDNNSILLMVGGENKLVATDPLTHNNKVLKKLYPKVKNAVVPFSDENINTEELNAQAPDVVISADKKQIETLKNSGIATIDTSYNSFSGLKKAVTLTGKIVGGKAKKQAVAYNQQLDDDIYEVGNRTRGAGVPKVLHITNKGNLLKVDGQKTLINEEINTAGGKNIIKKKGNAVKVSAKDIKKANPDYIIVGNTTSKKALKALQKDSHFKSLRAVKNKKVYGNPTGISRWDSKSAEADVQLWWLASKIHTEEVKDVNIPNKVKNFYIAYFNHKFSNKQVKQLMNGEVLK